jgi:hypothetical protein
MTPRRSLTNPRPISVVIIAILYIVMGTVGIAYHLREILPPNALNTVAAMVLAVRLLAIVCGIFLLQGRNWARWITVAWMALHVGISALHSLPEMLMHLLFLVVIAFVLFQQAPNRYFAAAQ